MDFDMDDPIEDTLEVVLKDKWNPSASANANNSFTDTSI